MPQDATVTSYNGKEETAEITKAGVRHYEKGEYHFYTSKGDLVNKEHVDIMGF